MSNKLLPHGGGHCSPHGNRCPTIRQGCDPTRRPNKKAIESKHKHWIEPDIGCPLRFEIRTSEGRDYFDFYLFISLHNHWSQLICFYNSMKYGRLEFYCWTKRLGQIE